jgi:hypothetical protein
MVPGNCVTDVGDVSVHAASASCFLNSSCTAGRAQREPRPGAFHQCWDAMEGSREA